MGSAIFGVKPDMVLKNGMVVMALMGDENASIPTPQPYYEKRCLVHMEKQYSQFDYIYRK